MIWNPEIMGTMADWVSGMLTATALWLTYRQYRRESNDRIRRQQIDDERNKLRQQEVKKFIAEGRNLSSWLSMIIGDFEKTNRLLQSDVTELKNRAIVFDNEVGIIYPAVTSGLYPLASLLSKRLRRSN